MSILRIIGVVIGLMLLVVGGFLALFSAFGRPSAPDTDRAFLTTFFLGTAVLGFFIARRSNPLFLGNFSASPARWLIQPSTRSSPLGMAIWTLFIALVLLALAPRGGARGMIAMIAFLIYLLFAMIALAAKPGWWRRALLTLLLGPVVMTGLMVTAEAFEDRVVGEASLGFVGLLMWSWAIIPVTGLIRLVVSRPSAPPDSSGQAS
jgi:hypothetical protein